MENIEYVSVDKDILDFLKVIYFGTTTNPIESASDRAYRDMNRTIRFKNMPQAKRECLRHSVTTLFQKEIPALVNMKADQNSFDFWHQSICCKIRTYYCDAGIEFYYGQAQKWINMTLKYLYISGAYTFEGLFPYLHVPIDNYIFSIAKKELGIPQPKISWSRWDDYKGQYMAYQTTLRSKIHGYYPLRWEFKFWMKEAHQLELETNIANDTSEKILILRELKQRDRVSESYFYDILERIGIIKNNYGDYMTTAPIDCDTELQRLPDADYDLTCALITMLLREDHFNNGAFERRYRAGQVQPILQRMINLLTAERS